MSIVRGRDAVRGPAGVGNADVAADRSRVEGLLQDPHLADGAQAGDPAALEHGNAGRIVAAVLQAPQTFHENGNRIALRNDTHDSTHSCSVRGEKRLLSVPDRDRKSSTSGAALMHIYLYYLLTSIMKYIVLAKGG